MVARGSLAVQAACTQNGLTLTETQLGQLEEYAARLIEWNKKINLISRRDEENFWTKHILHCLSMMFKVEIADGAKVLDLGTGGGLPGVVLKIARPDLVFTLLDSTQKKIKVVASLIDSLGLFGIDAVWGRAEDLGKQPKHGGRYDLVVARSVAPLKDLAAWSFPFLRQDALVRDLKTNDPAVSTRKRIDGPALVAFKGGELSEEINQLRSHRNMGQISIIELTLKGSAQLGDTDKKLIVVEFARSGTRRANTA
jgi:16S rRNA (guanine(527)-N(7))-methyltransferase RsmG